MKCLGCSNRLVTVREETLFDQLTYDVCERCGGLWLDKGELDKITVQTPGSVEFCTTEALRESGAGGVDEPVLQKRLRHARSCRRCPGRPLTKMHFMGDSKILMDYCTNCGGMWLDGGELERVNEYIRWFDKKAKPSKFDHFLRHMHGTYWHKIDVRPSAD